LKTEKETIPRGKRCGSQPRVQARESLAVIYPLSKLPRPQEHLTFLSSFLSSSLTGSSLSLRRLKEKSKEINSVPKKRKAYLINSVSLLPPRYLTWALTTTKNQNKA
jgi:hypothetical protein